MKQLVDDFNDAVKGEIIKCMQIILSPPSTLLFSLMAILLMHKLQTQTLMSVIRYFGIFRTLMMTLLIL